MKRVVITRPRAQADEFAEALVKAGYEPVYLPVIEIRPPADLQPLQNALRRLESYDWVVFTSTNGVKAVWENLHVLGIAGLPTGLQVAAIGPKTAGALRDCGVKIDFVPGEYIAEAILPGLGNLKGKRVLLPRASVARKVLIEEIQRAGGVVDEVAAYETVPGAPDSDSLQALKEGVTAVTLTSSSTVYNFVAITRQAGLDPHNLPGSPLFACIGPITASTARAEGLEVHVVALEYTTQGLLQAMLEHMSDRKGER
jgi:uroporphyrinogen-III synthase